MNRLLVGTIFEANQVMIIEIIDGAILAANNVVRMVVMLMVSNYYKIFQSLIYVRLKKSYQSKNFK